MQARFRAFGTAICICQPLLELFDLSAVGIALELGDLEGGGELDGALPMIYSSLGHFSVLITARGLLDGGLWFEKSEEKHAALLAAKSQVVWIDA